MPRLKHHETGRISAIDEDAHTFTLTGDKDQKKYTFEMKDRSKLASRDGCDGADGQDHRLQAVTVRGWWAGAPDRGR